MSSADLLNRLTQVLDGETTNQNLVRGRCSRCGSKPIFGKMVQALSKTWHYECWYCSKCRTVLGEGEYYVIDEKVLCKSCGPQTN